MLSKLATVTVSNTYKTYLAWLRQLKFWDLGFEVRDWNRCKVERVNMSETDIIVRYLPRPEFVS